MSSQEVGSLPPKSLSDPSVSAAQMFAEIDKSYVGIKKIENDVFVYRAQDVLIQDRLEMPLIAEYGNSLFTYEFATSQVCVLILSLYFSFSSLFSSLVTHSCSKTYPSHLSFLSLSPLSLSHTHSPTCL